MLSSLSSTFPSTFPSASPSASPSPPPTLEQAMMLSLWQATRLFLAALPIKSRQDYFLALFFYKAVCDEWTMNDNALRASFPQAQAAHDELRAELSQAGRWQIPKSAHFATLFNSFQYKGLGQRLERALQSLEKSNPDKLKGVFSGLTFDFSRISAAANSDALAEAVMRALAPTELPKRASHSRQAGPCFSALIEQFMQDNPPVPLLCPTPIRVAQLMASLLAPAPEQIIYDPACGTGALLVACAQWIQQRHAQKQCQLLGQDCSDDSLKIARMQLLLHHMDNHRLLHGETLSVPLHSTTLDDKTVLPQVDIAVCHPPEILPKQWISPLWQDPYEQFGFGLPTLESASLAFVLHMLACLKPETGRMAALLPRSIFCNLGNDQAILQNLLDAKFIDGVICLPSWLFVHPERPQVIMLLRHQRQTSTFCWLDASGIAQDNPHAFERITEFFFLGRDVPGYARMLSHADIKAGGYRWDIKP